MILVFGSINLDIFFPLEALPAPGQTVLSPAARIEPGGKGANQAVAAARDGAAVVMAGAVGRDALAEGALAGLTEAGVDLSLIARVPAPTGCAGICTDRHGRNQIAVAPGANMLAKAAEIDDARLGPGTTLLLQMECAPEETAALIRRARARGAHIVLNLAPALPLPEDALRAVDLLAVNEDEAAWLAGQLGSGADAAALSAALGTGVVRTLGEAGAEAADAAGTIRVPAHPVTAIDSTGAGDCFLGVLAAELDRGAALEAAMRRAAVAAALSCTRPGSQGSLPLAAETNAALALIHT